MEDGKNTHALMGGALLAAGVALVASGIKRAPERHISVIAPKKTEKVPSTVTVNVNTTPAQPPKKEPPRPLYVAQKPPKKKGVRYKTPISVSDKKAKLLPIAPLVQPAVMPSVQPSVLPHGFKPWEQQMREIRQKIDNTKSWYPGTNGLTFNTTNGMYELEGIGADGLDGSLISRIRALRARGNRRQHNQFARMAALKKRKQQLSFSQALRRAVQQFQRNVKAARRPVNASLANEAKMRKALEILRRNGMF